MQTQFLLLTLQRTLKALNEIRILLIIRFILALPSKNLPYSTYTFCQSMEAPPIPEPEELLLSSASPPPHIDLTNTPPPPLMDITTEMSPVPIKRNRKKNRKRKRNAINISNDQRPQKRRKTAHDHHHHHHNNKHSNKKSKKRHHRHHHRNKHKKSHHHHHHHRNKHKNRHHKDNNNNNNNNNNDNNNNDTGANRYLTEFAAGCDSALNKLSDTIPIPLNKAKRWITVNIKLEQFDYVGVISRWLQKLYLHNRNHRMMVIVVDNGRRGDEAQFWFDFGLFPALTRLTGIVSITKTSKQRGFATTQALKKSGLVLANYDEFIVFLTNDRSGAKREAINSSTFDTIVFVQHGTTKHYPYLYPSLFKLYDIRRFQGHIISISILNDWQGGNDVSYTNGALYPSLKDHMEELLTDNEKTLHLNHQHCDLD